MSEHTSGWTWDKQTFDHGREELAALRDGEEYILSPRYNSYGGTWIAVDEDHAAMIKAAPDLLDALKAFSAAMFMDLGSAHETALCNACVTARAAIKAAEAKP